MAKNTKTKRNIKTDSSICDYKHQLVDTKISEILRNIEKNDSQLSHIEEIIEKLRAIVYENQKEHAPMEERLKNQINVTKDGINNKLDKIDETLKGNGKIGLIEQIRNLNLWFKIIISLAVIIIGGQVFGIGLQEIKDLIYPKKTTISNQNAGINRYKSVDPNLIEENTKAIDNLHEHLEQSPKFIDNQDPNSK